MRRKALVLRLLALAPLVCLLVIVLIHCQPGVENQPGSLFIKEGEYRGQYWPTAGWRTCGPGAVGMDSNRLMKVYEYAASPEFYTDGLAIVHKGYIVGEVYLGDYSMTIPHEGFSVTKSFTSALVGIAVDKGLLQGVHEKVFGFFPRWQGPGTPGAKKRITIRHLLTLTSGLEWNEDHSDNENDYQKMVQFHDYLEYVLSRPVAVEPGTRWNYSSGDCMLLSGIIREVSGMSAYEFARENLFTPLGIYQVVWRSDPTGQTVGGSQLGTTVREFAKFGYLYLKKGQWENQQVLSAAWVEESMRPVSGEIDFYGYLWWRAPRLEGYPGSGIPADTMFAWGFYNQKIFVIPSLDLVIVRVASDNTGGANGWSDVRFLSLILDAVVM